jgi:threonyl-tRNA synthetase
MASVDLDILRSADPDRLIRIRHTTSHVLAMAVQSLFPETKVTIGPWIENGFYYDFDRAQPFTPEDLKRIKKEMIRIINKDMPLIREEVSREEAKARIEALHEAYKLEILEGLQDPISIYHVADQWWDLCAGPHLERTGQIHPKAFELESVAGAYWRGDEKRAQLQRIYGTAWETPEQLEEYQRRKEEAKRRDHRKLGKELGLFIFSDLVGPGLPLWTPKGTVLRSTLEDFLKKEQVKRGYQGVVTPHLARTDLFKTSGHWQLYKDDMFPLMRTNPEDDSEGFVLKPMNCPHHIQIYKSELRSYRELPLRFAEFGTVYRYEQSGELGGLTRVRGFTVDDAHLFVMPSQLDDEFRKVVDLILFVFKALHLEDFSARLSFRDPDSGKYMGSSEAWDKAQGAIRRAVQDLGMSHFEAVGEAAFYGPKLDFIFRDALGREWQLGTVQVDYQLPERFGLEYMTEDGSRQHPVMIHRAPFGSLERLIGILIEQYAGDFPLWLSPIQARIIPVTEEHLSYGKNLQEQLLSHNIRAEIDESGERIGKKVRNAEKDKVPYMLVVGDKEVATEAVSVRTRAEGELGALPVVDLIAQMVEKVQALG